MKFKSGFFDLAKKTHQASETEIFLKKIALVIQIMNQDYMEYLKSNQRKTVVNKGIFTSCKKNNTCPPWSVKAENYSRQRKKQLTYDKAFLRVYDYPVMYFPKFFHPDPTVERQSGF